MKILLVGSHGTGKSTLAKEIQRVFPPPFYIIDNIHRDAKANGFEINKTDDVISQIETVRRYLREIGVKDNFVSVDSIIRQTAYAICNNLPEPVIGLMKELCYVERAYFANIIFYFPIDFSLVKDGIRDEDIEFQKKIDVEIVNLLNIYYWNMCHTVTGTVSQRSDKVVKILELCKR